MTSRPLRDVLNEMGVLAPRETFRADLHTHSTVSDGSFTFAELVLQATKQGLTHIAFTNHDTTYGIGEALQAAEAVGLHGIGGIEVSAFDFKRNRKVHILGLGLKENSPALAALCGPTLAKRNENTYWQVARIKEAGYDIDKEKFERLASASTCAYKQHIMAALTDEPHESPVYRKLYQALFRRGGIAQRNLKYVDAHDAVQAICEDKGHPVLAHPGQLKSWDAVAELTSCGLEGIEKYHPDHTPADQSHAQELAEEFGLFVTGGSDFHGAFGKPEKVGVCFISG